MEGGWYDVDDEQAEAARLAETNRLRQQNMELRLEVERLGKLLHEERKRSGLEKPKPSLQEKIAATAEAMCRAGAPEADIEAFMASEGIKPSEARE